MKSFSLLQKIKYPSLGYWIIAGGLLLVAGAALFIISWHPAWVSLKPGTLSYEKYLIGARFGVVALVTVILAVFFITRSVGKNNFDIALLQA